MNTHSLRGRIGFPCPHKHCVGYVRVEYKVILSAYEHNESIPFDECPHRLVVDDDALRFVYRELQARRKISRDNPELLELIDGLQDL